MDFKILSQIGNFLLGISVIFVGLFYYSYYKALLKLKDHKKAKLFASEIVYNLFVSFLAIVIFSYFLVKEPQNFMIFLFVFILLTIVFLINKAWNWFIKFLKKENKSFNLFENYEILFYLTLVFLISSIIFNLTKGKFDLSIYLGTLYIISLLVKNYIDKKIEEIKNF